MRGGPQVDGAVQASRRHDNKPAGSAAPQVLQKLFAWREPGSVNVLIRSVPDSQVIVALDENRFAAWAVPVSLRQRLQWHRKKLSNVPDMRNVTAPHRHCPVVSWSFIHVPFDRDAQCRLALRVSLWP